MFRGYNLRQRVVIDIASAECIGIISDVEIDESNGNISAIIIKRRGGIFRALFGMGEIRIPWTSIEAVGREYVLVKSFEFGEKFLKN